MSATSLIYFNIPPSPFLFYHMEKWKITAHQIEHLLNCNVKQPCFTIIPVPSFLPQTANPIQAVQPLPIPRVQSVSPPRAKSSLPKIPTKNFHSNLSIYSIDLHYYNTLYIIASVIPIVTVIEIFVRFLHNILIPNTCLPSHMLYISKRITYERNH